MVNILQFPDGNYHQEKLSNAESNKKSVLRYSYSGK